MTAAVWQHLNLAPNAGMAANWWQPGAFQLTAAVCSMLTWRSCMASSIQVALRRIPAANDRRCLEGAALPAMGGPAPEPGAT